MLQVFFTLSIYEYTDLETGLSGSSICVSIYKPANIKPTNF